MAEETPLANSSEVRTTDGTLLDQTAKTETIPTEVEPKPAEAVAKTEPEAKADAKPDDKSLLDKKDDAAEGAPEKYETFTVPEGYELDEKVVGEASALFKDAGLSQAKAQALVDLYAKHSIETQKAAFNSFQAQRSEQQTKVLADPALGDGKTLRPEVSSRIAKAIDMLPNPKAFREAMAHTGAGDFHEVVRAIDFWSQRVGEGTAVRGGGPAETGQAATGRATTAGQVMYPGLPSAYDRS